jgi:hypothetical protein
MFRMFQSMILSFPLSPNQKAATQPAINMEVSYKMSGLQTAHYSDHI